MAGRPEFLFLAHRIPYPPDKGDKIRAWRILEHLAKRFDVHLAAFVDAPEDWRHEEFLKSVCVSVNLVPLARSGLVWRGARGLMSGAPMSFAYYRDGRMTARVAALRRRALAAEMAFSSAMAPYLSAPAAGRPRLFDFCDADSEKWRQYAEETRGLMGHVYRREWRCLADAETRLANACDAAFAVSAEEAEIFNAREGLTRPVDWFGNGVDAAHFSPDADVAPPAEPADVVFIGAMDYRANVEAVLWFAADIWPGVREKRPNARFAVIGPRPAPAVKALDGAAGIVVTGRVPDTRGWLKSARVAVAPLKIARGVQNKVLEAMAAAAPVVATRAAATGIAAKAGEDLIVADAPEAFAEAVSSLLADPLRAATIGAAGRRRVIADYGWPQQLARLDAALERLGLAA